MVLGVGAARRYRLGVGSEVAARAAALDGGRLFDAGGTAFDSEIWADVTDVQDDTRREGYSGLRLTVAPGAEARALVRRIESDGRFTLEAKPETTYYAEQAETARSLYILVLTLAIIMGIGATFGALNTMYAAVAHRTAEIGTLRALGFGRGSILASFLAESMLLAAGGLVAGIVLVAAGHARRQHVACRGRVQHDDLHRGDGPPPAHARRRPARRRLRGGHRLPRRSRARLARRPSARRRRAPARVMAVGPRRAAQEPERAAPRARRRTGAPAPLAALAVVAAALLLAVAGVVGSPDRRRPRARWWRWRPSR